MDIFQIYTIVYVRGIIAKQGTTYPLIYYSILMHTTDEIHSGKSSFHLLLLLITDFFKQHEIIPYYWDEPLFVSSYNQWFLFSDAFFFIST